MTRRFGTAMAVLVTAVVLLAGCVQMPSGGPVVEAEIGTDRDADLASDIDAQPPAPGASRLEIVNGFLEAMMAWPINTSVAKEYLTERAAESWNPNRTVLYSDLSSVEEDGGMVTVRLSDATLLDDSGGWQGRAPRNLRRLTFRLTVEDDEYRILDPVDALVVRTSWFQRRYRQVSVSYFDPTGQVLVPEPVFVPGGEQFATSLVGALLAGPPADLRTVVRTYVPRRLTFGLSVPVSDDGVATIDLQGGEARATPEESELMLAQFAATLGQEPSISAVRVSIGGEPVLLPDGSSEYDVDAAAVYDLNDGPSSGVLFGLSRNRLVAGGLGQLDPVDGPLGDGSIALSTVAVSTDELEVVGVTADRTAAVQAPVEAVEGEGAVTVVSDGTDISQPTWDAAGRVWLLDRASAGARVLVLTRRGVREVDVAGVTGEDARQILVSRDGTRLITVIHGRTRDRLVASRVVLSHRGRLERVTGSHTIWAGSEGPGVIDVAWTGPVEVAALTPVRRRSLFEIETVSVDGATVGIDSLATVVAGNVVGIAGDPYSDSPVFAVSRTTLVDIRTGERWSLGAQVRNLDFAG